MILESIEPRKMEIKPSTSRGPVAGPSGVNTQRDLEFSSSSCQTISDLAQYVHIESEGLLQYDNSTSFVLHYCKYKILKPYFRLMAILGWRPLFPQWRPSMPLFSCLIDVINWIYTLLVIAIIFSGYVLQYGVCYRHDGFPPQLFVPSPNPDLVSTHNNNHHPFLFTKGPQNNATNDGHSNRTANSNFNWRSGSSSLNNSNPRMRVNNPNSFWELFEERNETGKNNESLESREERLRRGDDVNKSGLGSELTSNQGTCPGNTLTLYILPDIFHFAAYVYVLYLMRNPESERLATLMERSFLQTTKTTSWFIEQKKLIKSLWICLWFCIGWCILSVVMHIVYFLINPVINRLIVPQSEGTCWLLNTITVGTLSWNDIICAAIVTNYAVHCQLNISYILNLCRTLGEKRVDFEEFYKRADETRKFVSYLNNDQALGVSLLLINFGSRISVATYGFLELPYVQAWDFKFVFIVLSYALLWLALLGLPLIQALRLTSACNSLREMGHVLRSRPFGYQDTAQHNLDSLLLYTSNIKMGAKLFFMPVKTSSVALFIFTVLIVILLIGQIG